jgi:hypothetical protein
MSLYMSGKLQSYLKILLKVLEDISVPRLLSREQDSATAFSPLNIFWNFVELIHGAVYKLLQLGIV